MITFIIVIVTIIVVVVVVEEYDRLGKPFDGRGKQAN